MKNFSTITTHACHCEGQSPEAISEKVPQSLFWQTMIVVCVSFFAMILLLPSFAFAEVKIFEKEYTYQASEIDSKVTSRAIAVEQVKRLVLEELGTYLMAETEVRDFQITKDRVVMLTAGIVQTEILNEKWDGERYYLKARIKADPNEVAASLDALRKDAQKSKELEDVQKKADEALKEIEKLKSEIEAVKADKNKQKEYAKTADRLSAADWFKKGYQYALDKEYDKAIEAFTSAIALDPNDAVAYNNRGVVYGRDKGQYDRAIEDYNKAIQLDPNLASAYNSRGYAYNNKGQHDRAIEDYNKAIQLDPNLAAAYNNRGNAYGSKGQHDRAIEDFNKAIALDPNDAAAYNNRGVAYKSKGQHDRAIEDFNKAIQLDPNDAVAYNNRGVVYDDKGQYDRAIEDYNKAIQLDPNYARAYISRGYAYNNKGQSDRAIEDYNKAIQLDPNDAAAYAVRGIAYYKKGNMGRAISDLQKACDMGFQLGCKSLQIVLENR